MKLAGEVEAWSDVFQEIRHESTVKSENCDMQHSRCIYFSEPSCDRLTQEFTIEVCRRLVIYPELLLVKPSSLAISHAPRVSSFP